MRIILVFLALAVGFAATPAPAEDVLSIEDVRDMAFAQGIVELKKIELDDDKWEVEGKDEYGDEIEMDVDAQTGRIIKMERD